MDEKKTLGCQEGCPLGKVLGQRECPGKRVKERLLDWLRPRPEEPEAKEPKE
jgi:hypothetical protein